MNEEALREHSTAVHGIYTSRVKRGETDGQNGTKRTRDGSNALSLSYRMEDVRVVKPRRSGAQGQSILELIPAGSGGASGNGASGNGASGNGASGSRTSGSRASGNGATGNGATGNGASGNGASGNGDSDSRASGNGASGSRASGNGASGIGASGNGASGSQASGNGASGSRASGKKASGTNPKRLTRAEADANMPRSALQKQNKTEEILRTLSEQRGQTFVDGFFEKI